jgi:hypothetical protein
MPKLSAHSWRKRAAIVAVAAFGTLAAASFSAGPAVAWDGGAYAAPAALVRSSARDVLLRPVAFRRAFAGRRFDRDEHRFVGRRFVGRRFGRDDFHPFDRDERRFDPR